MMNACQTLFVTVSATVASVTVVGRQPSGARDLYSTAAYFLSAILRFWPDARFGNMKELNIAFPASTIPTSPIIWADLAELIFICPELEISA
jgi:hypothetical protein